MTLVVPTSSADPGRAARPVLVETPTAGAEIARFGEIATRVGTQIETDRLDRQMKRLQVDMTRDLNDLRLEVAQIGDPDLADQTWEARLGEIRESYNAPGPDGRPRVDPRNAEDFGLAFEELANRHAYALGAHTLAMRQSEREATYLAYAHEATKSGATADPGTRQELLLQGYEQIDGLKAAGIIDAEEAQRRKMGLEQDIDNARAIRMIDEDPEAFLSAAEDGEFPGLSGEQEARYKVQAGNALEAQADAAGREAEAAAKAQDREIGQMLAGIREIAGRGNEAVDERFLARPEVQAHPDYAETRAALDLRAMKLHVDSMSPQLIRAMLAEEKSPVGKAWELDQRELLEKKLAEHEAGYGRDAIGYAQASGVLDPETTNLDPGANPKDLVAGLRRRMEDRAALVERGYVDEPGIFSETERAAFGAVAKAGTPQERRDMALALAKGLGRAEALEAGAELGGDALFGWAVSLAREGASETILTDAFNGQQRIADKTVRLPSRGEVVKTFHDITDGLFFTSPETTKGIVDTALALYAEAHPAADPESVDTDDFEIAVHRALGGVGHKGGFQKVWRHSGSDYHVPLPADLSAAQVGGAMTVIGEDLRRPDGFADGPMASAPWSGPDMTRLAAASARKDVLPDFGDPEADGYNPGGIFGEYMLLQMWRDGRPSDNYVLVRERNGQPDYLLGTDGEAFEISLRKLVREASR